MPSTECSGILISSEETQIISEYGRMLLNNFQALFQIHCLTCSRIMLEVSITTKCMWFTQNYESRVVLKDESHCLVNSFRSLTKAFFSVHLQSNTTQRLTPTARRRPSPLSHAKCAATRRQDTTTASRPAKDARYVTASVSRSGSSRL